MATIVFVDLETTGVSDQCEAIQIGAQCGSSDFSVYMMPEQAAMEERASQVHGLRVSQGRLYKNNQPVAVVPRQVAWFQFIAFLRSCNSGGGVTLAAHNGSNLDFPVMVREARRLGLLAELQTHARGGAADTVPLFREKLPLAEPRDLGLQRLAERYGVTAQGAHDAQLDAAILQAVCNRAGIGATSIQRVAKPLQ